MKDNSPVTAEAERSGARDLAFEQLLRLAVSFASQRAAARQGKFGADARRSPLDEDIELRAYHLYLGRGASHGHDVDDWLKAEEQVLEGLRKDKNSLRLALAFGLLNSEK